MKGRSSLIILIAICALFGCKQANKKANEITPVQQSAFDALNTLQVSTDEENRIYSTFAGIDQPSYPPVKTIFITQSELLMAMERFVEENCTKLTEGERKYLASTSVLAEEHYILHLCHNNREGRDFDEGVPYAGTWVIQSILDKRDLVLVW